MESQSLTSSAIGISDSSTRDLLNHVAEFLGFLDFPGTLQALEAERNDKRAQVLSSISTKAISQESRDKIRENMLRKYDEGKRDDFLALWTQYVPASMLGYDLSTQKIEFYLNIYFSVFPILPSSSVLVATPPLVAQQKLAQRMKAFKHFLETRGASLAHTGEFLMYYALPFVQQPELHPSFEHMFLTGWVDDQRSALRAFLEGISPAREVPKLYLMFESFLNQDGAARLSPREHSKRQSVSNRRTPPRERDVMAMHMPKTFSLGRSMSRGGLGVGDSGRISKPVSSLLASHGRGLIPTNHSMNGLPPSSRMSGLRPPLPSAAKISPSHFRPGPSRIPGPPPDGEGSRFKSDSNGSTFIQGGANMEAADNVLVGTIEPNLAAQIAQAGAMFASLDPQAWPPMLVNETEGFDTEPFDDSVDPSLSHTVLLAPLDYNTIQAKIRAGAEGTGDVDLAARLLQALRWRLVNSSHGSDRWSVLATYIETDLLSCNSDTPLLPILANSTNPLLIEETARLTNALSSDRLGRSYLLATDSTIPALFHIAHSTQAAAEKAAGESKPPSPLAEGGLIPSPPVLPRTPSFGRPRSSSTTNSPNPRNRRTSSSFQLNVEVGGVEGSEGSKSGAVRAPSESRPPLSRSGTPPPAPSSASFTSPPSQPVSAPSTPSSVAMAAANSAATTPPSNLTASVAFKQRDSAALQQALVALQKLSLKRSAQRQMIEVGVLQWVVHYTQDASMLSEFTLEYCCALMMNLSLRSSGRTALESVAAHLLLLCEKQLESGNEQIRTYINGTLYSAVSRPNIREVAISMGYPKVLKGVMARSSEVFGSQIQHILQQLLSDIPPPEEEWAADEDGAERDMDYDDDDGFADLSMAPESVLHALDKPQGEQLLCESYLLTSGEEARSQIDAVRASMAIPQLNLRASQANDDFGYGGQAQAGCGGGALRISHMTGVHDSTNFGSVPSSSRTSKTARTVDDVDDLSTAGDSAAALAHEGGQDVMPPLEMGAEPSGPSDRSRVQRANMDASTVLSGSVVFGASDVGASRSANPSLSESMSLSRAAAASRHGSLMKQSQRMSVSKSKTLSQLDTSKPMTRPITPSLLSSSMQGNPLRSSMGGSHMLEGAGGYNADVISPVAEAGEGLPLEEDVHGGVLPHGSVSAFPPPPPHGVEDVHGGVLPHGSVSAFPPPPLPGVEEAHLAFEADMQPPFEEGAFPPDAYPADGVVNPGEAYLPDGEGYTQEEGAYPADANPPPDAAPFVLPHGVSYHPPPGGAANLPHGVTYHPPPGGAANPPGGAPPGAGPPQDGLSLQGAMPPADRNGLPPPEEADLGQGPGVAAVDPFGGGGGLQHSGQFGGGGVVQQSGQFDEGAVVPFGGGGGGVQNSSQFGVPVDGGDPLAGGGGGVQNCGQFGTKGGGGVQNSGQFGTNGGGGVQNSGQFGSDGGVGVQNSGQFGPNGGGGVQNSGQFGSNGGSGVQNSGQFGTNGGGGVQNSGAFRAAGSIRNSQAQRALGGGSQVGTSHGSVRNSNSNSNALGSVRGGADAGMDSPQLADAHFTNRPPSAKLNPLNSSGPIEAPPREELSAGVGNADGEPKKIPERIRKRMEQPKKDRK